MRDLALFREHLQNERKKHLDKAHHIAMRQCVPEDYGTIVSEHVLAEQCQRYIDDLKSLEEDTGEFVKKFLQQREST